jgi:hypothetical protein
MSNVALSGFSLVLVVRYLKIFARLHYEAMTMTSLMSNVALSGFSLVLVVRYLKIFARLHYEAMTMTMGRP